MDATAPTQSQEEGAAQPPESQASDASSTAPDALDRDQQNGLGSTTHQGNGVPPSPTAGRASTPQTGPAPVATPSAGSASGSDSAGQLVDTLHIVATDRNAVDKYDLYELFSVQDGFQRIAWQNEGYSFVKFQSHEHAIACLRSMKRQLEAGTHDKLNSIKITVAKMSYVPNYKVPTQDDFSASATLHLSHFPKDSTVLELRRFFSRQCPDGFERLIFHINYCHVLFKDVENAARTKEVVNRTTNFVLAFAKNVTDMKSRINANGVGHAFQGGDMRRTNGGPQMGGDEFGPYGMQRPRPFPGNQYGGYGGYDNVGVNQAYSNLQNRDYERRTKIQTAQAQMRLAGYNPGAGRGRDGYQGGMAPGYDGMYGDYSDRGQSMGYGRPGPHDMFDKSAGMGGRYGNPRYRNQQGFEADGFRDDYGTARGRGGYGANDYIPGVNGNVDWALAAMQKAAAAGGTGGWDGADLMRLQQQQQQQQQAQINRMRADYEDPLRNAYPGRLADGTQQEAFPYDLQQRQMRGGAFARPSPAPFYDPSQNYYGDFDPLTGMGRSMGAPMNLPSGAAAQSFDRTIRPPTAVRRMSDSGDDLVAGAFASILQPNGQDDLAQITSTFQNSFGLGNTVS